VAATTASHFHVHDEVSSDVADLGATNCGAELSAIDLDAELGAASSGAELAALYPHTSPELPSFVPPPSRFLFEPPLAQPSQTTNLTLKTPIETTNLQEQGIIYALLNFHAWISYTIGALLRSLFIIRLFHTKAPMSSSGSTYISWSKRKATIPEGFDVPMCFCGSLCKFIESQVLDDDYGMGFFMCENY